MNLRIAEFLCVYALLMSSASYAQLTYSISNNQVTITGNEGEVAGHLEIPSEIEGYPVTEIGGSFLMGCDTLSSLTIPDSVVSIGGDAFYGCYNLKSVDLGNGVNTIYAYAFRHCFSLPSLVIPSSVTTIYHGAFSGCGMTSITFRGNAPFIESWFGDPSTVIYYHYGTTNWSALFYDHPTTVLPECLTAKITPAGFVMDIVASDDLRVMAETCSNLSEGNWIPVTIRYMTGAPVEITIRTNSNDSARFYRFNFE